MKTITMILGLMISSSLQASDPWSCKEMSSERSGNVINACGVGSSTDEGKARSTAFNRARAEFDSVCQSSSDCVGHYFTAKPMRTTCDTLNGMTTCYRMVSFAIGEQVPSKQASNTTGLYPWTRNEHRGDPILCENILLKEGSSVEAMIKYNTCIHESTIGGGS